MKIICTNLPSEKYATKMSVGNSAWALCQLVGHTEKNVYKKYGIVKIIKNIFIKL